MNKVSNAQIRELWRAKKGVDERINEGVLWWFGHVARMHNDNIAKRVYVWECVGSRSIGQSWKRCIDPVKDCLNKKCLGVTQARSWC